ncbi:MAG: FtsK/SpoIIIE domain-containing protein [Oligoflexia bacterium]|nr:FtsK/SpoIIIE domain-containing protein [Oligoflexia bacterium]
MNNSSFKLDMILKFLNELLKIFIEIFNGFLRRDKKLYFSLWTSFIIGIFVLFECDIYLFKKFQVLSLYPSGIFFKIYAHFLVWLPILLFGIAVSFQKKRFHKSLIEVFDLVGLKNSLGSYPRFLLLENLLEKTMILKVTNGGFPLSDWEGKRNRLEANMHIFIDEIKQIQEKGIIEIIFSYEPMPRKMSIDQMDRFNRYNFLLGRDRAREYLYDFSKTPHLLIAGETGGGKSAFMRQLITTIKYNQPESEFYLVDLKGGVEFSIFEKFPKTQVIMEPNGVIKCLNSINGNLKERANALKARKLTKIEDFFDSIEYKKMSNEERLSHILGRRIFVVIDECAEIFLIGKKNSSSTHEIREAISSITRLGRFAGIHVILGTQRPDRQAIDPQVKSNLPATVCFRIHDHGGSLAVLGNGKATKLPNIPGRAILQLGSEEIEIQTPLLDFKEAIKALDEKFPAKASLNLDQKKYEEEKAIKSDIII